MDATAKNPADNIDAARVNAFYIANTVHDFFYRYGFTEVAFNFQQYNFNQGGKEGDRVLLSVQHDGLKNNANFATHPEYVINRGQITGLIKSITVANQGNATCK